MSAYVAIGARIINHAGEWIETINIDELVTIERSLRKTGETDLADKIAEVLPSPPERDGMIRSIVGFTRLGQLRQEWGTEPEEWGLLGPIEWDDDEVIRVVSTHQDFEAQFELDAPGIRFERQDEDGDWYVCIDTPEAHRPSDLPAHFFSEPEEWP